MQIQSYIAAVLFSYTVGLRGDSQKYIFNMAILLCVYYEYYCKKVSSLIIWSLSHLIAV